MTLFARRSTRAAVLAAGLAWPGGAARAEGTRPDIAFGSPAGELAVAALSGMMNITYLVEQRETGWEPSHTGENDGVIGGWSDLAGAVGGALVQIGGGYAFEAAYLEDVGASDPGVDALFGMVVEGESLLLAAGTTTLIKRLAGRCRPRAFRDGRCDEFDAFPSGHTSAIGSIAGARLVRLAETPAEDGGIGFRAGGFVLAEVGTIAAAALRMTANAHNWEDVLVGGLVGHASGVLVGLAHPPKEVPTHPGKKRLAAAESAQPIHVSIRFAF